jgi:hypothetical protein
MSSQPQFGRTGQLLIALFLSLFLLSAFTSSPPNRHSYAGELHSEEPDTTPPVLLPLTAQPATALANGTSLITITGTLRDALNAPVPGIVVTFRADPDEFVSLQPVTTTTDATGRITTTVRSTQPGKVTISAEGTVATNVSIGNALVEVTFSNMQIHLPLTSLAPPLPLVSLKDGSFETGSGWTQAPPGEIIYACAGLLGVNLRSGCVGNKLAWLGGVSQAVTHSIAQPMTLTQLYPVTVRFRYFVASQRAGCDNGVGEMWSGAIKLFTIPLCRSANPSWQPAGVVLPQVDGSQLLKFQAVLPGGVISSFFVDDISLCSTSPFKHPQMPACP